MESCPNCHAIIKDTVFGSNALLDEKTIKIINAHNGQDAVAYCGKCGTGLGTSARNHFNTQLQKLKENLSHLSRYIMVVTTHSPYGWEYDSLGMVTGQSTMGTGVVTEFTSGFTDFFGMESDRHNSKVAKGENRALAVMRSKAIDMGAHAIIAVDIDYSELGALKGMILVCTSGTAVKVRNLDIFPPNRRQAIEEIQTIYAKIQEISELL